VSPLLPPPQTGAVLLAIAGPAVSCAASSRLATPAISPKLPGRGERLGRKSQ